MQEVKLGFILYLDVEVCPIGCRGYDPITTLGLGPASIKPKERIQQKNSVPVFPEFVVQTLSQYHNLHLPLSRSSAGTQI